mgnify:CR=1 FL=1
MNISTKDYEFNYQTVVYFVLYQFYKFYILFFCYFKNYLLIGFLILWLACRVYNWVAKTFGGIELELQEMPLDEPARKTSEKISFLEKHQD